MTPELTKLRKIFYAGLEEKTGWGRNQIIALFEEALTHVIDGTGDDSHLLNTTGDNYVDPKDTDLTSFLDPKSPEDLLPPW